MVQMNTSTMNSKNDYWVPAVRLLSANKHRATQARTQGQLAVARTNEAPLSGATTARIHTYVLSSGAR